MIRPRLGPRVGWIQPAAAAQRIERPPNKSCQLSFEHVETLPVRFMRNANQRAFTMKFRTPQSVLAGLGTALLLTSVAPAAHSAPVDDLRRGTRILLRGAYASVRGQPMSADYLEVSKTEGTLDLVVSARALGIDYDATFHLSAAVEGDRITWTFDEAPSSPWDLGGGVRVHRVRGKLVGRLHWLPGGMASDCGGLACNYNVGIESIAGTVIEVHGESPNPWLLGLANESWIETIGTPVFSLYAGVPQPALAGFEIAIPSTRMCTSTVERRYSGEVRLTSAPSRHGAWVDVSSSDPDRLSQRRVFVAEGETTARITARFPGDYAGNVVFTAAAGGVMQRQTVSVNACLPSVDRRYLIDTLLEDVYECASCLQFAAVNDRGDSVALRDGKWSAAAAGSKASGLDEYIGGQVQQASINPLGDLLLRVKAADGKEVAAHVRGFMRDSEKIAWLADFSPTLAHASGTAFGLCPQGPCVWNGPASQQLPLASKSQPVGVMGTGVFVANDTSGALLQGEWSYLLEQGRFGSLGGSTSISAVNEAGTAVGWSEASPGLRAAVAFEPTDWSKPIPLNLPKNVKRSAAVGVAEDGTIAGNAETDDGKLRSFLAHAQLGAVFLDGLVEAQNVELHEVLAVSPGGLIVVRGLRAGKPELFVLREK